MKGLWRKTLFVFAGTLPRPKGSSADFEAFINNPCFLAMRRHAAEALDYSATTMVSPNTTPDAWRVSQGAFQALRWLLDDEQLRDICSSANVEELKAWEAKREQLNQLEKELCNGN